MHFHRNPSWLEGEFFDPLDKRIRKLCRTDMTPYEISEALNIPASWVAEACEQERGKWRDNPERILYPYRPDVIMECSSCGDPIFKNELCEAVCVETESGTLLAPHEVYCEECIDLRENPEWW